MLVKLDGGRVEHQQTGTTYERRNPSFGQLKFFFPTGYRDTPELSRTIRKFRNFDDQEVQTKAETQSLQGKFFRALFSNTDGSTQSHTPTSFWPKMPLFLYSCILSGAFFSMDINPHSPSHLYSPNPLSSHRIFSLNNPWSSTGSGP